MSETSNYDAVIVLSFGGPERREDVIPFLRNVTRGRDVPAERLERVAQQYYLFDGVSPINRQNRSLVAALETELREKGPHLPVYFGNRNWHPLLTDTVAQMAADGIRRALAFATSAYSSYSSCRQYLQNIEAARRAVGPGAPVVDKLRAFWNHPGFIEPLAERAQRALSSVTAADSNRTRLVFTAHSVPITMADSSDYPAQLLDAATLVADRLSPAVAWDLVYQSRSGPPGVAWLEPDILDHLQVLASSGVQNVVVVPIGFVSDHMEVVYDLDTQAKKRAEELGLRMVRAATVGDDRRFVAMIRELLLERTEPGTPRRSLGQMGIRQDFCAPDCCPPPKPRARIVRPEP